MKKAHVIDHISETIVKCVDCGATMRILKGITEHQKDCPGAASTKRTPAYRITRHECSVPRTDQWLPRTVTETVWMIEGPGVNRPATDIEIAIYKQGKSEGK